MFVCDHGGMQKAEVGNGRLELDVVRMVHRNVGRIPLLSPDGVVHSYDSMDSDK